MVEHLEDRIIRSRLMTLIVLAGLAIMVWLPNVSESNTNASELTVKFLDIGQGDAIFIETPDGVQALIDGGRDGAVLKALGKEMGLTDRDIDLMVATHPDSDHIGGLIDVLERYKVAAVLMTENEGESSAAATYHELVTKEEAEVVYARRGQVWQLGASTTLEVLWPESDPSELESNTSSIILMVTYGDTSFLLTGDAPKRIEEYLVLTEGEHLKANVLKVGHHGSRTSTSELFLTEVRPQFALLSYGEDNRYGHPHVEVTDLLFNYRIETYSTAKEGTVSFYSDGMEVWVK